MGDIDPVRDEHVVAFEYGLSIELDSGECIQAIESQDGNSAILQSADLGQTDFVCPGFISNPFGFELVESKKGVGYSMRALRSVMH